MPYPPRQTPRAPAHDVQAPSAFAAAQANYYQHHYQPWRAPMSPVNVWYSWRIAGFLLHIAFWGLGIGGLIGTFIAYGILGSMFPDTDPNQLALGAFGCGVLAVTLLIYVPFYKWRKRRRAAFIEQFRPRSQNERFAEIGLAPNPPTPWFGPDGQPLYEMTPAGWVLRGSKGSPAAPPAPQGQMAQGF